MLMFTTPVRLPGLSSSRPAAVPEEARHAWNVAKRGEGGRGAGDCEDGDVIKLALWCQ